MKKFNLIFLLAIGMWAGVSCKDDEDDMGAQLAQSDETFLTTAADGGMFEVKAGELAVANGGYRYLGSGMDSTMVDSMGVDSSMYSMIGDSARIATFGQTMVTDHNAMNAELKTLADSKGVTVPTTLTARSQANIDSLSGLRGRAFTSAYVKMMLSSHQETVNTFQAQADGTGDTDIKSWASTKLPSLKQHLEMAQVLGDSVK